MTLEKMTLPVCDDSKLLPVVLKQMPLPMCDGSKLFPVALEQMPLPDAPETEQESSSAALEYMPLSV